jgi:hypothetical protein
MERPALQYPPDDPAKARADAAAALLAALRDVRDANDRLQFAAAFVLEAFGDTTDAETIRMLPVGGPARPGKPAVPPPASSRHLTDDLADSHSVVVAALAGQRPDPDSVTGDESGHLQVCVRCRQLVETVADGKAAPHDCVPVDGIR